MFNLEKDVYYDSKYARLYLEPDESIFEFKYEENEKFFYIISIKRPIMQIALNQLNGEYFDLETPYGYGGPISNCFEEDFLNKAWQKYTDFCRSENIIAEFIRFHPFNESIPKFSKWLDLLIFDRETISINLQLSKSDRWTQYSSTTKNILRKSEKILRFIETNDLNKFIELYNATMKKNNAADWYYFDKKYFEELLDFNKAKLFAVTWGDEIISAAFFLTGQDLAHYHLSANNYEFAKLNANYFILDEAANYFSKLGKKYLHLGGGTTSSTEDSLFNFKRKFSQERFKFHIAGKIYNRKIYDEYCQLWQENNDKNIRFFLKYRLK